MGDRLHLTQVPRASINDACVSSALIGECCHLGTAGKRAKLSTRNDPQPVIGCALTAKMVVIVVVGGLSWVVIINKDTHICANTHLCDLKDRDGLLGALSVCQQQFQLSVPIQVCHGATCPQHTECFHCTDLYNNVTAACV